MVDIFWLETLSVCARSLRYTLLIRRKKNQLLENRVEILEEEKVFCRNDSVVIRRVYYHS